MEKTDRPSKLTEEKAKEIIERLYSNSKNWRTKVFRDAYFVLTGQKQVLSKDKAEKVVEEWISDVNRDERLDYVSAVLLLTGKWISPKPKIRKGMSQQIKVKYERGNISSCSSPIAYRK